ncbi:rhomboid family intramembrane serine protease [Amylibacter ulvae]|uniref:Rhomboid family intramembrane serine protease n=1 Tax=Paramylibacter ulvae TaxID=1651968 RepID=A0ABQ3D4K3_9RHOB|nr:rhomboid family intramembrane serine protease [Amylibacter ulvae]GHA50163.1 rhomboid family intramembrane serine protease [Amylibacter ulvae]
MYDPDHNVSPIHALPPVVVLLTGLIAAIELLFQAGAHGFIGGPEAIGWRISAARQFGFFDQISDWMFQNQSAPLEHVIRLFTYGFIHRSFPEALIVCVYVLALGNFVAKELHWFGVLSVFFTSQAFGAIGYALILNEHTLLIGGYPAAFGLIGAFTWIVFAGRTQAGKNGFPAFRLIAMFMAFQAVWKIAFGGNNQWLVEIIAFGVGFSLCIILFTGKEAVLEKIRQR